MAPSSNFSYHVAGPLIIQASCGTSNAVVPVGTCRDGAELLFRPFTHDIKHDGAGGPEGDAAEIIFLNYSVEVRCQFVPYSGLYVNRLRAMSANNNSGTEGVMVAPGTLFGASTNLPSITFTVSSAREVDGGWTFNTCQVVAPGHGKWGVTETMPDFGFRAINYIAADSYRTAGSIVGNVLYVRS